MKLALCYSSGFWHFKVAHTFVENLCIPAVGPEILVFLTNSFIFQCLYLSMHFSVMTTDVCLNGRGMSTALHVCCLHS